MSDEQLPTVRTVPEAGVDARAGDADREAVAEQLRIAAGEGRIDLAELDERLELAFASRTYRQLDSLVADLAPREEPAGAADEPLVLRTRMRHILQKGVWEVPRRIVAETGMGLIVLDFTSAVCPHREVTVEATCGAGQIKLVVPQGWGVRIGRSSTNTGQIVSKARTEADPGFPVVTVIGHPRSGYVRIKQSRRG
ncbi:DUF1707 SHOCT-like domain-containing protein [Kitasatospora sp. NPDC094028]